MGREVPFDMDAICDCCGAKGAYDFMGDYICQSCIELEEAGKASQDEQSE